MFGSSNELTITLALKDSFSKELDKAKGKMMDFSEVSKKAALIGTAAFASFAAIGISSIEKFMESEKEMAIATKAVDNAIDNMSVGSLNNLQKQVGLGVDVFDAVEEKMKAVGKAAIKLGFDDESASKGFAKLFQISGNLETAQTDLQRAMDLSAFSGRSLEESVNAIAQVYAGGGRVLKEFGISVDENATALEILDAVQKKTGGSAEALSKTYSKQMDILKIQIDNIQESIGAALAPAITKVLEVIGPLIDKFAIWAEKNPETLSTIILIGGAVSALVAGIGLLGMAIPGIIAGFGLLTAPVLAVAGIIAGLILTVTNLIGIFKILKNDSGLVWEGIKITLKEIVNGLIGMAEGWANGWIMAINFIIKGLNKIQISVPSWVPGIGGKSYGINIGEVANVSIPRLEHGGIVPGSVGTAVPIIAHGQERVIPASQAQRGEGGGSTYTVVINNPSIRSQSDLNEMRRQIDESMRDLLRVHKLQVV